MSSNLPTHSISSIFLDQDLLTNPNAGNNTFIYDFAPRTVWTTPETKMSVANFSVPYSWFNISAALQNNLIGYVWYDRQSSGGFSAFGATGQVVLIQIPDGYYDIATLNNFLQFNMIQNSHYLIDNNQNYVYFLEIVGNVGAYRLQVNSYPLPASLPSGWSLPTSGYNPFSGANPTPVPLPQLLIFNTNADTGGLFAFLGFYAPNSAIPAVTPWGTPSTYPPNPVLWPVFSTLPAPRVIPAQGTNVGSSQISILSDLAPLVSQVHSVCLTCSSIDNPLRSTQQHQVSTRVLTTQSVNVPFGENLTNSNFFTTWIPLTQNTQISQLQFQLTDQEGNTLVLQDPDTNIELLISNLKW
jgi:hypothetical protein